MTRPLLSMELCVIVLVCTLIVTTAPPASGQALTVDEFPLPSRTVGTFGMAADTDGSVWYAASYPSKIGHVSPGGHITEYVLPAVSGDSMTGIVIGPDGNLWFGETGNFHSDRIGRMSRTGTNFVEFPVASSVHGTDYLHIPHYLIVGPDSNIWFTAGSDALGRITVTGDITLFYLPADRCGGYGLTQYGNPYGLTVGPDGAIWVAAQSANAILRFDLATEQFQIIPIAACGAPAEATNIVTGPDGNLWVTDFGFSQLYRVSLNGDVAAFPLPGNPFGIVADGSQLFVTRFDHQFNEVSRIDLLTGAAVADYPIPTAAAGPENIVVDPAGNLWLNEQDGHNIARLSSAPLPCIDDLALTYANSTLTLHFALKSGASGTWGTWLAFNNTLFPLWIQPIPPMTESIFDVPIDGFPNVGPVAVLTLLANGTPALCGDLRAVDTATGQLLAAAPTSQRVP